MNRLYLLLLFSISLQLTAQKKPVLIKGIITSDSIFVENVHVINKTSHQGTVSNTKGAFEIAVSLNDTLLFSGIQFYTKKIKINQQHLEQKIVLIDLFQKINTLGEVLLKPHDLTGTLFRDAKKAKDTTFKLNPQDWNTDPRIVPEINRNRPPDASKLTNPNVPIGGDLIGLTIWAFTPVIKSLKKINKTKREIKVKEKIYVQKSKTAPQEIRIQFGDDFFTNTLNIPVEQIDAFIVHCESKNIIRLYLESKNLEMLDIFLSESKTFKKGE